MSAKQRQGKITFMSGATRRGEAAFYHLLPSTAIRRIAERFSLGAVEHGEDNWKLSMEDVDSARIFCADAYNHVQEHLMKMMDGEDPKEDHLGAAAWGLSVLMYAEQVFGGKNWRDI
jgi:hypothetical protein